MAYQEFAGSNDEIVFPIDEMRRELVNRRGDLYQELESYYSQGKSVQNSFAINDIRAEIDGIDSELFKFNESEAI